MEQREQKANSFALCRTDAKPRGIKLALMLEVRRRKTDRSVVTEEDEVNALQPGTVLPIHRHTKTSETVVILRGKMEEIFFEENPLRETSRVLLEASGDVQGLCIPKGQWHTVNVIEPTIILECKDGKFEPLGETDMINL